MTGEELLIELHRRGIKQKELAYKLGLTHPMISYYVRGRQTITPDREKQIKQALEELSVEKRSVPPPEASEAMSA
ncbi:MAG: helix-turn-helix domain-containing protein [Chloroflexota bacterium]|nr:helix-turn-helix domain-containing protein [Chloroflexota bacterium]